MKNVTSRNVLLENIDPPTHVARFEVDPEKIQELADSIQAVGQLQPIELRPHDGRYEIVSGHRRFLATKLLGRKAIWAVVVERDDITCIIARATENLAREDLSPLEEAEIYRVLFDDQKMSIEEIGKRFGKSPGVVKRRLDLLKMPPQLQKAIHSRQISWSVGEELWRLVDLAAIDYYLGFAVDHGATKDVVRLWVHDHLKAKRTQENAGDGGGGFASPLENRPVYVSCDICHGPMEIGQETTLRCCGNCTALIKQAMKGG